MGTSLVKSETSQLWNAESMKPRHQAKRFGVPNKRQVLLVKKMVRGRVKLLIEVSKTENGKFFIVVFQRYLIVAKTSPRATIEEQQEERDAKSELFDDIKVKEMWQMQAI